MVLWASEPLVIREMPSRGGGGMGVVGHAIDHTVVALPLGLGAYVSLALREGQPNPCPHHPSAKY